MISFANWIRLKWSPQYASVAQSSLVYWNVSNSALISAPSETLLPFWASSSRIELKSSQASVLNPASPRRAEYKPSALASNVPLPLPRSSRVANKGFLFKNLSQLLRNTATPANAIRAVNIFALFFIMDNFRNLECYIEAAGNDTGNRSASLVDPELQGIGRKRYRGSSKGIGRLC